MALLFKIVKIMFKYNSRGYRINPSVQIATSITQVFKNSLSIPQGEPQFDEKKVNNVFDDPLMHFYDPVQIAEDKEYEDLMQKQSQIVANTQNPVSNVTDNS